jgi:hypothetical protein
MNNFWTALFFKLSFKHKSVTEEAVVMLGAVKKLLVVAHRDIGFSDFVHRPDFS